MTTLTRQYRIKQGLSEENLARKALVTRHTVRLLESPEWHRVEPQHVKKVADALGVEAEVLIGEKSEREASLERIIRATTDFTRDLFDDVEEVKSKLALYRAVMALQTIIITLFIIL